MMRTRGNCRRLKTLGTSVRYVNHLLQYTATKDTLCCTVPHIYFPRFGEESMDRVLRWMEKEEIPEDAAILDIGTGNGVLLVELAKSGYTNLTGIDYSAASVKLARSVLQTEDFSNVEVKEVDFLSCSGELRGFDVCIDKGTFDAISLNPENTEEGKACYIQSLRGALKEEGLFVITSCNWTKEQLLQMFNQGFDFVKELPTPHFQFGGKTGNSVTAIIFKRLH
ncbi:EEF1A lysine methyltransferase 2 isoform X1 [Salvelinus namaycush]|uniref:EEF1A lysine methyltransferase 2 n=1 Tax=Salvelinus namaycush TaxID=8040 RepID=A0A8U0QNN8_SALNM|nr:EEF1A lysine methyltransferase 2 isoform X1 [Salvelinus namaycush]